MLNTIESLNNLNTTKRLPPSLKGTIFEIMLEAISEELLNWRKEVYRHKTTFFDINTLSYDRILEISTTLDVPFSANIISDIDFLREELRSTPFKVSYKGTPTLYKSFFTALGRVGEMFVYIYKTDIEDIIRSTLLPFDEADISHRGMPFMHRSFGDFSGSIVEYERLDDDNTRPFLDNSRNIFRLDRRSIEASTNHIGLEFFIDRLVKKDGKDYLLTKEYFDYLNNNIEFSRRLKEVPHIGAQLSVQIGTSGLCNFFEFCYRNCKEGADDNLCEDCKYGKYYNTDIIGNANFEEDGTEINYPSCFYKNGGIHTEYTIPSLKLKAVTHPNFYSKIDSRHDLQFAEFGIGSQAIASEENADIPFPSELSKKILSVPLLPVNLLEDGRYIGAIAEYKGQSTNEQEITGLTFDDDNQEFEFVLNFAPIQRNNVKLQFILPTDEELLISDDGKGMFVSKYVTGSINYETGKCSLNTNFNYRKEELLVFDQATTDNNTTFYIRPQEGDYIIPGSVQIIFSVKEDDSIKTYSVNDTFLNTDDIESGVFYHDLVDTTWSYVNYKTKNIAIRFNVPIVDSEQRKFIYKYSFPVDIKLPSGTKLKASYFFKRMLNITEVGFRNKRKELVAYATFPPIEFGSAAYHFNFMLLIRRKLFQIEGGVVGADNHEFIYDGLTVGSLESDYTHFLKGGGPHDQ